MGGLLSTKKVPAWHSGPEWAAFLGMYDERAAAELPGFASQLIHTTAGQTFVWTGGRADGPPVVFFHGAEDPRCRGLMSSSSPRACGRSDASSLWTISATPAGPSSSLLVLLVLLSLHPNPSPLTLLDYPCHASCRSVPRASLKTAEEHAGWARELWRHLGIERGADVVGYSYGSLVAAMVASRAPELIAGKRVVLCSPAAVFAPLTWRFLYIVLAPEILRGSLGYTHDWKWNAQSSASWDYASRAAPMRRRFNLAVEALAMEHDLGTMNSTPYSVNSSCYALYTPFIHTLRYHMHTYVILYDSLKPQAL